MADSGTTGGEENKPHRGGLILALGILGIVCCFVVGIVAWVMGSGDLAEMEAGRMDPAGRDLTQAGRICGIVAVALQIAAILLWLLFLAIGLSASGPLSPPT